MGPGGLRQQEKHILKRSGRNGDIWKGRGQKKNGESTRRVAVSIGLKRSGNNGRTLEDWRPQVAMRRTWMWEETWPDLGRRRIGGSMKRARVGTGPMTSGGNGMKMLRMIGTTISGKRNMRRKRRK